EQPDLGFVFCPELRTGSPEPIGDRGSEKEEIYLFGPALLPEVGLGGIVRTSDPPAELESAPDMSITTEVEAKLEEGAVVPSGPFDAGAEGDKAAVVAIQGPITISLGSNIATGEAVDWQVSIKGNPHLMVLGLPGMGKT